MGSAQIDKEDLKDIIIFSSNDRIKGKLHIGKVKAILINDETFLGILIKTYSILFGMRQEYQNLLIIVKI